MKAFLSDREERNWILMNCKGPAPVHAIEEAKRILAETENENEGSYDSLRPLNLFEVSTLAMVEALENFIK